MQQADARSSCLSMFVCRAVKLYKTIIVMPKPCLRTQNFTAYQIQVRLDVAVPCAMALCKFLLAPAPMLV